MDIEFPGCMVRMTMPAGWKGDWDSENTVLFTRQAERGGEFRLIANVYAGGPFAHEQIDAILVGLGRQINPSLPDETSLLSSGVPAICVVNEDLEASPPIKSLQVFAGATNPPDRLLIVLFDYVVPIAYAEHPDTISELQDLQVVWNQAELFFLADE